MVGTTVRRSPGRKGTPQAEPDSKPAQTVTEVLRKHFVLEVESIDRMYLNAIVPRLQIVEGALRFIVSFREGCVVKTGNYGSSPAHDANRGCTTLSRHYGRPE